jgi:transposase
MKTKKHSNLDEVKPKSPQEIAVELFRKNVSKQDISKILCVSLRTVWNWFTIYLKKGMSGIKKIKRGRPKGIQLTSWQGAQIVKDIINYCPDELSLPFFLWTREAVMALIFKKFNISLSRWTILRGAVNFHTF